MVSNAALTHSIKQEARRLGFDLCRITPIGEAPHADFFEQWLALERHGEMHYLARNVEKRRHPRLLADGASGGELSGGELPGGKSSNSESSGDEFRSMIVLAVNHYQFPLSPEIMNDPSRGIIASYAWGDDYHEIIRPALYELDAFIRTRTGRTTQGKCLVDTGPVLERDWAHRIGIGFTGKNCCTIHPKLGSWLLLATIMVPEKLEPDRPLAVYTRNQAMSTLVAHPSEEPLAEMLPSAIVDGLPWDQEYGRWNLDLSEDTGGSTMGSSTVGGSTVGSSTVGGSTTSSDADSSQMVTCGRCTRCMDDCPTDAFVGPYHLDPQRCISYWTIEAREAIPRELRRSFGNRIFGCDICQEVCPWNQRLDERSPIMAGLTAQAERIAPPLLEGFAPEMPYWLVQEAFSSRFRRSPIKRAKRVGMLRNVCVALGNWADVSAIEPLQMVLEEPHPLPRAHAAWALGEIWATHSEPTIRGRLAKALAAEEVAWVREEIQLVLAT